MFDVSLVCIEGTALSHYCNSPFYCIHVKGYLSSTPPAAILVKQNGWFLCKKIEMVHHPHILSHLQPRSTSTNKKIRTHYCLTNKQINLNVEIKIYKSL
jgi:hypothetical protein